MPERVSAIIPTYNRADLLSRALKSVARQDYRPIEAVVIDDGSTDSTPRVLDEARTMLGDAGVELVVRPQQNQKAPAARNAGMKLARGALIAFLDSDDLWRPACISTLARLLEEHPSAGLAFCGIDVIDPDDRHVKFREMRLDDLPPTGLLPKPFDRIVRYMPFQTSGVMVRRSVIDRLGDFDLDLPVVEDWDLWYRVSKLFDFAYTTQPLACNREHPANLPKFSLLALRGNLRMNLRHLPDVRDPSGREALAERIAWHILLLQEELLRQGLSSNGYDEFLRHELAPRSMRYRLGRCMRWMPRFIGRAYAGLIRWMGRKSRNQ